jgi:sulfate adenylyltransferase subunit 2
MLHLARKAFYPAPPPFPLMHVDTTWKFREMIQFRDKMAAECGLDLIVHVNHEGVSQGISPFTHGSSLYTDIMKTEGLKQALDRYKFDAAFGGARRDEEKSRAKERIFSFRSANHRWDPKLQRPELWNLYNNLNCTILVYRKRRIGCAKVNAKYNLHLHTPPPVVTPDLRQALSSKLYQGACKYG